MKRILISLLVLSMAGQVDCQAQFVKKLSEAWKKVKTTVNTLSASQKSKTTTATPSTPTGTSSGTKTTAATPTKVAGLDIKMPQVVKVVKVTSATLNIRKSASATAIVFELSPAGNVWTMGSSPASRSRPQTASA